MGIKKIKPIMSSHHELESALSSYIPGSHSTQPPKRLSIPAASSESTGARSQPSPSSRSLHYGTSAIDSAIPFHHHHHSQEQQPQQHPRTTVKRISHSVRYPPYSSSHNITPNDPSTKSGRGTPVRPSSVHNVHTLSPMPPSHHMDERNSSDGSSDHSQQSNSSSSNVSNPKLASKHPSKGYDEKTEEERRRVEQIAKEYRDMEVRNRSLEMMIRHEDDRFNSISRQFHHDTMEVRATDEDYSTIHNNLTILQAKIASLPLSLKPYLVDKQQVTDHFLQRWPHLAASISHLCKRKQPDCTVLDNIIISQLIEKLVTELLVEHVHQAAVHLGFPANDAYLQLVALMDAIGHPELSLRLRQQLCKITARSTTHNNTGLLSDTVISRSVSEEKAVIISTIVDELIHFYNDPQNTTKCRDELMTRIHKIVESAAEVSLAMRSQVNPVIPLATGCTEGKDVFDPELFTMQNGSAQDASVIQVIICPPFVFHENNQQFLSMKGKAICF